MNKLHFIIFLICSISMSAQQGYWQQEADYKMDIDFDVKSHQFEGDQKLIYTNNSPDTLDRVFYHLYFNAFRPGSMMDERSRTIADPDPRVGNRIAALNEDEMGYQRVKMLTQDGLNLEFEEVGTILEVNLAKPILPGETSTFDMKFEAQVPLQIRRSGRDNKEGIAYSMTQWYPKLSEYDHMGWHANPYIGREFHGVWGDFEVNINIDAEYVIGATGLLQNAEEIGHGYQSKDMKDKPKKGKLNWNFKAENVIDFAWAADPDYQHITYRAHDGTMLHFLFQPGDETSENWARLPMIMDEALKYMNATYGKYQFPVYTFIQGGDGGMEYPMITLITGERSLSSLVGVSVHEWMHSWYQFTLATNESLYSWMDEGFTSFASAETMNHLRKKGLIPGIATEMPHISSTKGYVMFSQSGIEEALTTHSDHFKFNTAYGRSAYTKGSVFLSQLEYVIGNEPFRRGLIRYFNTWKFKHPTPNDIIRIMEKESGLELDWYKEYFVNTTKTVDYAISEIKDDEGKAILKLEKKGDMPMPIDILVELNDGRSLMFHIPLRIMRGSKTFGKKENVTIARDWPWVFSNYELNLGVSKEIISRIKIDPSERLADIIADDNEWINSDEGR